MRIHGFNPAAWTTSHGANAGPGCYGQAPDAAVGAMPGPGGPELALRLMPAVGTAPPEPDLRFMAQLVGQRIDAGATKTAPRGSYGRSLDGEAERPYWAGRPVKFWA